MYDSDGEGRQENDGALPSVTLDATNRGCTCQTIPCTEPMRTEEITQNEHVEVGLASACIQF